jgi:hypothetical protein
MGDEKDSVGLKRRRRSRGSKMHRHTSSCLVSLATCRATRPLRLSITRPISSNLMDVYGSPFASRLCSCMHRSIGRAGLHVFHKLRRPPSTTIRSLLRSIRLPLTAVKMRRRKDSLDMVKVDQRSCEIIEPSFPPWRRLCTAATPQLTPVRPDDIDNA